MAPRALPAVAVRLAPADSLSLAVLLASVLGSWLAYGRSDLALDEGYTSAETRLPLATLWRVLWARELNGSLHTVLMWSLDEPGPTLLRVVSTVFMVGALALLHLLVRKHFGPWPALVSVAVAATNPTVQQDMVTGRTYALSLLLVVLSLVLLDIALRANRRSGYLWWGVVGGIMLYAHFLTGLVLAAQVLWLLGARWADRRLWIPGVLLAGLVAVPIGIFFLSGGGLGGQLQVLPHQSLADLLFVVNDLIAGYARAVPAAGVAVVVLVLVLLARGLVGDRSGVASLAAAAFLGPVVMLAAGAHFASSLYFQKYLVFVIPGLAIGVGAGVSSCVQLSLRPTRLAAALVVGLGLATNAVSVGTLMTAPWTERHPLTAAMQAIGPGQQITTAVSFEGYLIRPYAERAGIGFVPATPLTAATFLQQSRYEHRGCAGISRPGGPIWIVSVMSLDFDADYRRLARCWGYRPKGVSSYGPMRVVELVPAG